MKFDFYSILKSGRTQNAFIGVLASEIVSLLFSGFTWLIIGSLVSAFVAMVFIVILLKYCDVFEKKAYVLRMDKFGGDLNAAAFRNTLVELGHIKSPQGGQPGKGSFPSDTVVIKKYTRRLKWYCSLILISILLSVGFAIRGGMLREREKKENDQRIEAISKGVGDLQGSMDQVKIERQNETFLIQELKYSIDTLKQFRQEKK